MVPSTIGIAILKDIWPFQRGDRLYTSESGVHRSPILMYKDGPSGERIKCWRQILTYKNGPRTERIKTFIMAIDP